MVQSVVQSVGLWIVKNTVNMVLGNRLENTHVTPTPFKATN